MSRVTELPRIPRHAFLKVVKNEKTKVNIPKRPSNNVPFHRK